MNLSRGELSNLLTLILLLKRRKMISFASYIILKHLIICCDDHNLDISMKLHAHGVIVLCDEARDILHEAINIIGFGVIDEIFNGFTIDDAHEITMSAIEKMTPNEESTEDIRASMIYGEVEYNSFAQILLIATKDLHCGKFMDLGHGTGRAVCIAALLHDFKIVGGMELITGLNEIALQVSSRLVTYLSYLLRPSPEIQLITGSFLTEKNHRLWTDADLVFANSTCFSSSLLQQIAEIAIHMRQGSRVITFTSPLPSSAFKILHKQKLAMSWGAATVYIHERVWSAHDSPSSVTARSLAADATQSSIYWDSLYHAQEESEEQLISRPPCAPYSLCNANAASSFSREGDTMLMRDCMIGDTHLWDIE